MKFVHIIVCFAIMVQCNCKVIHNMLEVTDNQIVKDIEKRNSPEALPATDIAPDLNSVNGITTLFIQIFGGLLQNMFDSNGGSAESVNQALTLFNAENIRANMILIRRTLNLLLRVSGYLGRLLPEPTSDNNLKPLGLLKSKVSFYSTQPLEDDDMPLIDIAIANPPRPTPAVPERIQKVVEYAIEDVQTVASTTVGVPETTMTSITISEPVEADLDNRFQVETTTVRYKQSSVTPKRRPVISNNKLPPIVVPSMVNGRLKISQREA